MLAAGDRRVTRGPATARPGASGAGRARSGNRLLDMLSDADAEYLLPFVEELTVDAGTILYEPGDDMTHASFPCEGTVVSMLTVLRDGRTVEAASVGAEGALGVIISAGEKPAFTRGHVQAPGRVLRLEAARHASVTLRDLIARYADCLLAQVLQAVACNALHSVEARTSRWLLTMQDRTRQSELAVTQEHLAEVLGVRRTTVTRIFAELEATGAIRHTRGKVEVLSRPRLERGTCECFRAVRDHFDRVAPGLYPRFQGH